MRESFNAGSTDKASFFVEVFWRYAVPCPPSLHISRQQQDAIKTVDSTAKCRVGLARGAARGKNVSGQLQPFAG